jgi:DHA3 family tetracycline resistance protein-like MFS transporter
MKAKKQFLMISAIMSYGFLLYFTASVIYRIDVVKLEPYQLIFLGFALEISVFLFEIPTGILADLKSRKLSILIGLFIVSLGLFLEASTTTFWIIFASQTLWGFGYTFISGALSAWVSDETQNIGVEQTFVKAAKYRKAAVVLGILSAGLLGSISVRGAMVFSGLLFLGLSGYVVFFVKEELFVPVNHHTSVIKSYGIQLLHGIKHIWNSKILRILWVVIFLLGLFSEGIDRLNEVFILDEIGFREIFSNVSPIWITSIVALIIAILGFLVLSIVEKHVHKTSYAYNWLIYFTITMIGGLLIFTYMDSAYIAVSGFIVFQIVREAKDPLIELIQVRETPVAIKATVLSTMSQTDAIGQLVSGPLMAWISFQYSMQSAFLIATIIIGIILLFLLQLRWTSSHRNAK